jgi:hypothetical protein
MTRSRFFTSLFIGLSIITFLIIILVKDQKELNKKHSTFKYCIEVSVGNTHELYYTNEYLKEPNTIRISFIDDEGKEQTISDNYIITKK